MISDKRLVIKDRKAGDDALSARIDTLNGGVTGSLAELRLHLIGSAVCIGRNYILTVCTAA